MLEKDIERKFTEYAKSKGCIAYKFTAPGRVGVPDRLVICPRGINFFIEFKTRRGIISVPQKREIERLRNLGQRVFVCRDLDESKLVLDTMLERQ